MNFTQAVLFFVTLLLLFWTYSSHQALVGRRHPRSIELSRESRFIEEQSDASHADLNSLSQHSSVPFNSTQETKDFISSNLTARQKEIRNVSESSYNENNGFKSSILDQNVENTFMNELERPKFFGKKVGSTSTQHVAPVHTRIKRRGGHGHGRGGKGKKKTRTKWRKKTPQVQNKKSCATKNNQAIGSLVGTTLLLLSRIYKL